jgi:hypothetical protein
VGAVSHDRFRFGLVAAGCFLLVFGLTPIVWTFVDFMTIWWVLGSGAVLAVAGLPLLSYLIWRRRPGTLSQAPGGTTDHKEAGA